MIRVTTGCWKDSTIFSTVVSLVKAVGQVEGAVRWVMVGGFRRTGFNVSVTNYIIPFILLDIFIW